MSLEEKLINPRSFSRPKYRSDVDGMRALAILSVLIFHAYPSSLPGGFVGVDIFFVISGYLISSIIFRGLTLGTFSFFDFYARRVRRIFPAVTVVILSSFLLGFFFLTPFNLEELIEESPYAAFFLENWRLYVTTGGYWETATELKPFMHFWSLGVEEQYYIFYPLICFFTLESKCQTIFGQSAVHACCFVRSLFIRYRQRTGKSLLFFAYSILGTVNWWSVGLCRVEVAGLQGQDKEFGEGHG